MLKLDCLEPQERTTTTARETCPVCGRTLQCFGRMVPLHGSRYNPCRGSNYATAEVVAERAKGAL